MDGIAFRALPSHIYGKSQKTGLNAYFILLILFAKLRFSQLFAK